MNILNYTLDFAFVVIMLVTMVIVARRMMIESGLLFLAILISSLVAITVFEPIGEFCRQYMFSVTDIAISKYLWFSFALISFAFCFTALFQLFFSVFERVPQFKPRTELIGCWIFGAVAGYVMAAFLLTILQTLPAPRNLWGLLEPNAKDRPGPIMAFAPDYQFIWLADCICNEQGPQFRSPPPPKDAKEAAKIQRRMNKERSQWFPVRYATWREKTEIFDADRSDDAEPIDDSQFAPSAKATNPPITANSDPDFSDPDFSDPDYSDDY